MSDGHDHSSGAARFYLDAVGGSLGSEPISLEALADATPDAILIIDRNRRIRFWNRGAAEMFGFTREEATGAYYDLLLPNDLKEQGELESLERRTLELGTVRNHLTRRITKAGVEKIISLSRSPLRDARGEVVGWTAILRDVTDQTRVEHELSSAKSLAMLGELAATVAHEIKNPLAGIHGATQILIKQTDTNDPRHEILTRMATQIRRLDATVRDLLRFARPETPVFERRDLRALVVSLANVMAEDPRFANITIQSSGVAELPVDCDERLFHQVFQNLLENACDAMEGRGTIELTFESSGERAIVRIRDGGPGVPETNIERIFSPFFTTKARGTGLGLAICRKNIEAHLGRISVSNDPRGGAIFTISVPHRKSERSAPR